VGTSPGTVREKLDDLRLILSDIPEAVVAYSGGVDSSFLAVVARDAIGDAVTAVIADSPSLPRHELSRAIELAHRHELPLEVVRTNEMEDPRYRRNGADRCAFCKEALTDAVLSHPAFRDRTLLLGVNVDDLGDHRPGQRAARRHGARFPLAEAGLRKAEVRELARDRNLETWDKPAAACLASRLAYGVSVSEQALTRIERAEESLRLLGLAGDVRVRDQGQDLARIEVSSDRFAHVMTHRLEIVDAMREVGFRYVTLDLEGFRSGSHNLALSVERRVPKEPLDPVDDAYRSVARRNSSRSPGSSS
jgi:pyridinium-3,5-biscarboxylic acid mononucleotide sulfurtransferase